jgi:hypothetical protein
MKSLRKPVVALCAALLLGAAALGCSSSNSMLLEGGLFGSDYKPKPGQNEFRDDKLTITLDEIKNGGMGTDFAIHATVRNVSNAEVTFDPGEVELQIPETGLTYFHVTRNAELVSTPPGINVFLKTNLRPGQATQATLWFKTPQGKAEAKTLDVRYHDKTLHFPPGPQTASR